LQPEPDIGAEETPVAIAGGAGPDFAGNPGIVGK
jgi:hypothetical protein